MRLSEFHRLWPTDLRNCLLAGILSTPMLCSAAVIDLVRAAPEGSWLQVNQNQVSSVWTPPSDRNDRAELAGDYLSAIIDAWSSFAWDSSRSSLILFGGGHANYSGNDVYTWNGDNLLWQRSSLPSKIVNTTVWTNYYYGMAADGPMYAPASSHTYDNSVYLKVADRMLTFGGAAWGSGSTFLKVGGDGSTSLSGPFLFDPSRADANKVGGTTGSGVNSARLGGQMWQNRDTYTTAAPGQKPLSYVEGFSAATVEGGKDVVYVGGAQFGTQMDLYRYAINDLHDPTRDTWTLVGQGWFNPSTGNGSGSLDPQKMVFVRTGDSGMKFLAWDLTSPGAENRNFIVNPVDLTNGSAPSSFVGWGLTFDEARRQFVLWGGGGNVWSLTAPIGDVKGGPWLLDRLDLSSTTMPGPTDTSGGVLGKWHYAADLDAFVGLQDPTGGDVWIYKPEGWVDPAAAIPEPGTVILLVAGSLVVLRRVHTHHRGGRRFAPQPA